MRVLIAFVAKNCSDHLIEVMLVHSECHLQLIIVVSIDVSIPFIIIMPDCSVC